MKCPVKYLLVRVDQDLYDGYRTAGGLKIFVDNVFQPWEYSMTEAMVVGVPDKKGSDPAYAGMRIDMRPGDKILMSYAVIYDYVDQPDNDTPRYKNLIMYEGKKYWKCALGHVFAYIREGVTRMVNGWVMADPVEERRTDYASLRRVESAVLASSARDAEELATAMPTIVERRRDQAKIRNIGQPLLGEPALSVSEGETVWIDDRYVQTYKTETDEFLIFRQNKIIAQVSS